MTKIMNARIRDQAGLKLESRRRVGRVRRRERRTRWSRL